MFKYILQRIAFAILTLFIISLFVYVLVAAFGPNPVEALAKARAQDPHEHRTFETILKELELQNGISYLTSDNRIVHFNPIIRYLHYMFGYTNPNLTEGNQFIPGVFQGNFGFVIDPQNNPDPSSYKTMAQLFFKPLSKTIIITLPAFLISAVLGTTIGVFAGYKRGKTFDTASNLFVIIFVAIPSFILAPIVITISLKLHIPVIVPRKTDGKSNLQIFVAYLPPIFVMTLGSLAAYVSYTRNQVITVLTSNHVLIAKTKGLSGTQIFFKYVLRNISIPLFSLIFGSFLGLLSGSIIIEKFWQVSGTSQIIVNAFPTGEINIVMFSTLFFTFLSLIAEIIIDVSFVILDPKITYANKSKKNYFLFFKAYLERKNLKKIILIQPCKIKTQKLMLKIRKEFVN